MTKYAFDNFTLVLGDKLAREVAQTYLDMGPKCLAEVFPEYDLAAVVAGLTELVNAPDRPSPPVNNGIPANVFLD
jgi:hypothetical protein